MSDKIERPEFVTDEHLAYLDALRASNAINMFGAAPYVANEFKLEKATSRKILTYWMDSFDERK